MTMTRVEDHETKVMRVIPNWAVVSSVIGLVAMGGGWIWQAASAVAALNANTKSQDSLTQTVNQMRADLAAGQREIAVHSTEISNIKAQVSGIEARVVVMERHK